MTAPQIHADVLKTIRLWRRGGLTPEHVATALGGGAAWVHGASWRQIADAMFVIATKWEMSSRGLERTA